MVIISENIVPNGYLGITLFPFIFLKSKKLADNEVLLNHEKIHLRQQLELLIIPFYLIYTLEFLLHLLLKRKWKLAYSGISFEKEAFVNEANPNYLNNRRFWSFMNYF